jgi:hypothetical protein
MEVSPVTIAEGDAAGHIHESQVKSRGCATYFLGKIVGWNEAN